MTPPVPQAAAPRAPINQNTNKSLAATVYLLASLQRCVLLESPFFREAMRWRLGTTPAASAAEAPG